MRSHMRCPFLPLLLAFLALASAQTSTLTALYRINAGGASFTDSSTANSWSSDMSPVPGLTLSGNTGVYGVATSFFGGSNSVAVMASSERYTISDPFFSYTFAIPVLAQTSPLTARLWFSENYAPAMTTGFRVFNVAVNGVVCLSNFDIFASTGAGYALISRDCVISPSTSLTVTLARIGGHNDPKVDGIEIFSGSSNAVTPAPTTLAPSTVAPTSAPTSVLILARINCGGYAFTDSATGNFWADDSTATITGSTFTYGVAQQPAFGTNTLAPMLSSERWGNAASNQMSFVFQLPTIGDASTSYTLRMHFAEIYPAAFVGFRVFNVLVNGQQFLKNFDIFSAAGSQLNLDIIKDFSIVSNALTGNSLTVLFQHVNGGNNPKVSGFELFQYSGIAPTSSSVVKINCGGASFTDSVTGALWSDDSAAVVTGSTATYQISQTPFGSNSLAAMLSNERWGVASSSEMVYAIAVPTIGDSSIVYTLRMHFCEIYTGAAVGFRVFNVLVNGAPFLMNFDIFAATGSQLYIDVVKDFRINSAALSSPKLSVLFQHLGGNNPKISGFELFTSASLPVTTLPPTTAPPVNGNSLVARINCGGISFTDAGNGNVWSDDSKASITGSSKTFGVAASVFGQNTAATMLASEISGVNFQYNIAVPTIGNEAIAYNVTLWFAELYWTASGQRKFDVSVNGVPVLNNFDIFAAAGGANLAISQSFLVPSSSLLTPSISISFAQVTGIDQAKISGIEIMLLGGSNLIVVPHVVYNSPNWAASYSSSTNANVLLDGTSTHTHVVGRTITKLEWFFPISAATPVSTQGVVTLSLPLGAQSIRLRGTDSAGQYSDALVGVNVVSKTALPGCISFIYLTNVASKMSSTILNPSGQADWGSADGDQSLEFPIAPSGVSMAAIPSELSKSIGTGPVLVQFICSLTVANVGSYSFAPYGGLSASAAGSTPFTFRMGSSFSSSAAQFNANINQLTSSVDVRFLISNTASMIWPVGLAFAPGVGPIASPFNSPISPALLTHSFSAVPPTISQFSLPIAGLATAGALVTMSGIGFYSASSVVTWGSTTLPSTSVVISEPHRIVITVPSGTPGSVTQVYVQTAYGQTKPFSFTYSAVSAALPVQFSAAVNIYTIAAPASICFGPDLRLYVVSSQDSSIHALTLSDQNAVLSSVVIRSLSALPNHTPLGIAFSPYMWSPSSLWISHSSIYAKGGNCFTGTMSFPGQISTIDMVGGGITPVITNLPTSNHDHAVNGMSFDNSGNLMFAIGSNTNAGVTSCPIGGLPESPLTAAVLTAPVRNTNFKGAVQYAQRASPTQAIPTASLDQASAADYVTLNTDVSVWASGLRNSFDNVFTTAGQLWATDNGPNTGFGLASTGANSQSSVDANCADELNLIQQGKYYGHPNRNRGVTDPRQNIYHPGASTCVNNPPGSNAPPNDFTQCSLTLQASSDGITEFRSAVFGGSMRGALLIGRFQSDTVLVDPATLSQTTISTTLNGLDVEMGPGGVVFGAAYNLNAVTLITPVRPTPAGLMIFDVFPWRSVATATTAAQYVLTGYGFGTTASAVVVKIGGKTATITSLTNSKIVGKLPTGTTFTTGVLVDIVVTVGSASATLPASFMFLAP